MRRRCAVLAALSSLAVPATTAAAFDPDARVVRSDATGAVRFVGMPAGDADAGPAATRAAGTPAAAGAAYLQANARALGLEHSSVRTLGTTSALQGGTIVRYQQQVDGVDVLGGQFVVQLTPGNRVRSLSGEALPDKRVDTDPALSADDARSRAVSVLARGTGIPVSELTAGAARLAIFDARIMGGPGLGIPQLVWETVVRSGDGTTAERVFIHADRGLEVARISEIHEARNRRVCDANSTAAQLPCTSPVLTEGGTYAGPAADVQPAYDYSGATYDFLQSRFGRDSLDDAGLQLDSTVRFCPSAGECPYENAFWSSSEQQMVYGAGYATADDVVGHELTHGLTDFTSSLYYYFQSGAINESLSDVFGELIDQVTTSPDDAPAQKWLMGETIGAIRDMEDPTAFGDPDRMGSANWHTAETDSGGVHINSGVNNKAAFLMTDGGSFNGQAVGGLGLEKVARIYYLVETGMLTSASDYADLGTALTQACANLVGTAGITNADCQEVADAVAATEMLTDDAGATDMPTCAPGTPSRYAFLDDMEAGDALDRWVPTPLNGGAPSWYLGYDTPYGDLTYATSGVTQLFGDDLPTTRDDAAVQATATRIRPDSSLVFRHAFGFEDGTSATYDGGIVQYTTDGTTWADVPGVPYNGTINTPGTNPLGNRAAFVHESMGYITTVVPIPALTGQDVRFRFRIGSDASGWAEGWHIDDVGVIVCDAAPPDTAVAGGPADNATLPPGSAPTYTLSSNEDATFECRVDGGGFAPCAASFTVPALGGGAHTVEARSRDFVGNVDGSPVVRRFTIAAPAAPVLGGAPSSGRPSPSRPPSPSLDRFRIVSTKIAGSAVTFVVRTPAAGRVAIQGTRKARVRRRLRTVAAGSAGATATRAQNLTIKVRLNRSTARRLRRAAVRVAFTATFRPRTGAATTQRLTMKVKKLRR